MRRYDAASLRLQEDPTPPMLFREWLRVTRERQNLRQIDVVARLSQKGAQYRLIRVQLSKLENGRLPLSSLSPAQVKGLQEVLGISPEMWTQRSHVPWVERPAGGRE